jgi:uncharacterized RDD family membrane protein YckC
MIETKYRTFWKRFCAGFVDGLVFLPIMFLEQWVWSHHELFPAIVLAIFHLITTPIFYVYNIFFLGKYGQTLGKMALKIKVLDVSEMRQISYLQALRRDIVPLAITAVLLPRELYQIVAGTSYLFTPNSMPDRAGMIIMYSLSAWFLLECVTMLFSSKRRAIHDFIADSVVVRIK